MSLQEEGFLIEDIRDDWPFKRGETTKVGRPQNECMYLPWVHLRHVAPGVPAKPRLALHPWHVVTRAWRGTHLPTQPPDTQKSEISSSPIGKPNHPLCMFVW